MATQKEAEITVSKASNMADMPNLPDEIVVEILSRIPVKSLLRFRCVSKSWASLISDRQFIRMHLRMFNIDDNYSRYRVIFSDKNNYKSCSLDSIYSYLYNNTTIKFDSLMMGPCEFGSIVGSYDGLLCICSSDNFYLWNPSLRESKRLPYINVISHIGDHPFYNCAYGFGYDYSIDDYKVVGLWRLKCDTGSPSKLEVNVFTLRTNSWRRIQDYPHGVPCDSRGSFVSGALHWLSIYSTPTITALDLATETYTVISQPSYGYICTDHVLVELRGCLGLMTDNRIKRHIDLWIMKEYAVGDSWTKLASFPYLRNSSDYACYPYLFTLFVSKTDELLFLFNSVINLYDPKDDTFRSLVIKKILGNFSHSAIYFESLVSPHAVINVEMKHQ